MREHNRPRVRDKIPPVLEMLQTISEKDCVRCGNCCKMNTPIIAQDNEVWAIAKFLKMPKVEVMAKYFKRHANQQIAVKDSPCPFLEPDCCTIYPVRPDVCRRFPFISDLSILSLTKKKTIVVNDYCPASIKAIEFYRRWYERMSGEIAPELPKTALIGETIDEDLNIISKLKREKK